jgi:NADPH-dependent 2,4-dienoyl-CoA reductase/sulfur reductase-like enzyme
VVVGAGPAGLEAARVAGARGHAVTLFEAASLPGGQIRVAAGLARRKEILGIVDWRVAQCLGHGVAMRMNRLAEAQDVLDENPDIVVIATGGIPNTDFLDAGEALVTTSWDLLTGLAKPAETVIVYDDNGAHPGVSAAEFAARAGAKVTFATPERSVAPDIGATSYPPYLRAFSEKNVEIALNLRLERVRREGNGLIASFRDDYGRKTIEKSADQIIVEHGSTPVDELYFELKSGSKNLGEVDYGALIRGERQSVARNRTGRYRLFRIGDAVSSRNIHAAIYDAIRLAKDF